MRSLIFVSVVSKTGELSAVPDVAVHRWTGASLLDCPIGCGVDRRKGVILARLLLRRARQAHERHLQLPRPVDHARHLHLVHIASPRRPLSGDAQSERFRKSTDGLQ